ncbi:MAG: hypothetical protein JXA54_13080 [Candidatus Heimdallarchaeota archaeon]|nr:hypothetical protein [Candidatus Heimdallarchaeota archaeon]
MNTNSKNKPTCTILLLVITLSGIFLINSQNLIATYTIVPGETSTYILERSDWYIKFEDLSESGSDGRFNDLSISSKSVFTVEVLGVDEEWGVDFEISNSTDTTTDYLTNDQFIFEFSNFIYYPIFEGKRIVEEFDADIIKIGPEIFPWFFIQPIETNWNFLNNFTTQDYYSTNPLDQYVDGYFQASLERLGGKVLFDYNIKGSYTNESDKAKIQFDHLFKFIWNETSGVLLGYRISSYLTGKYFDLDFYEEIYVICRLSGYEIPNYKFIPGFIPGYSYFIAISSIFAIAIFTIVFKKRRKN